MQGKATFLGHPIHQMLVVFPLGLLGVGVSEGANVDAPSSLATRRVPPAAAGRPASGAGATRAVSSAAGGGSSGTSGQMTHRP